MLTAPLDVSDSYAWKSSEKDHETRRAEFVQWILEEHWQWTQTKYPNWKKDPKEGELRKWYGMEGDVQCFGRIIKVDKKRDVFVPKKYEGNQINNTKLRFESWLLTLDSTLSDESSLGDTCESFYRLEQRSL
jgi:hypothetical protein